MEKMYRKIILSFSIAFLAIMFAEITHSEMDEVQIQMLKAYEPLLRWDTVKSVLVRIPKGERIRVSCPACLLTKDDIMLDFSDGSGLYARLPVSISQDQHSLVGPIALEKPQLVLVSRRENKKLTNEITLFVSRHETLTRLAPYRGIIPLNGSPVPMSSHESAGTQAYWFIESDKTQHVKVRGPARYAFEHRLVYQETESRLLQTYQLQSTLNGKPFRTMNFETSAETAYPIYLNGKIKAMGRLEIGYLDIPAGHHTLTLNITANVYGRLLQQKQPDYLFPKLNEPKLTVNAIRDRIKPTESFLWNMSENEIHQNIQNKTLSPIQKEYTALRVVRDNSRREGGILGAATMQASAEKHLDYPAIETVAAELKGFHTFYRDIFPDNKQSDSNQYMSWFMVNRLHNPGEQGHGMVVGEQFLQELLNRISNAYFFDLPYMAQYLYYLPPRTVASSLRIVVDRANSTVGDSFYVQLGQAEPILFQVQSKKNLLQDEYTLTQGGAGLEILSKLRGELLHETLSGSFSQSHINAPLISAGVFELTLPPDVHEVKVWRASQSLKPLYIALQYRTSKPFVFTESEYQEVVRQLGPNITLNRTEIELKNYWLPLYRFLSEQNKIFSSAVSPNKQDELPASPTSKLEITTFIKAARHATAHKKWLPALEAWSQIKRHGNTQHQREAQQKIIESLFNLGEHYLTEQQLRWLLLYSKDSVLRTWANEKLLVFYRTSNDLNAIVALSASRFLMHPGIIETQQLFDALLENNEYEFALMVGLTIHHVFKKSSFIPQGCHCEAPRSNPVLNSEINSGLPRRPYGPPRNDGSAVSCKKCGEQLQQNIESMLRAAYQVGWWDTFNRLIKRLDSESDRAFWRAIKFVEQGNTKQAHAEFELAGLRGIAWRNHMLQGHEILTALLSSDLKIRMNGIHAWEQWQMMHPGPFLWQEDASLVRDHAGAKLLYAIERDAYSKAFKGTSTKPVLLEIVGPVKVRLETRPLLSAKSNLPVEGWLRVRGKNIFRVFPINNNTPSQGIKLFDQEGYLPGNKVFADFDLGPGTHKIQADSDVLPFLVRVLVYRPEIRVPPLPPLNIYTVNAVLNNQIKARATTKMPCFFASCLTIIPNHKILNTAPELQISGAAPPRYDNPSPLIASRSKESIIRRMIWLLWLAEHDKNKRLWAIAEGEHLVSTNPLISELQPLKDRMTRNTEWLSVTHIENSAGLRYIKEKDWQPESPAIRVRKALLGGGNNNERVLFGHDQLVYVLKNLHPSTLLVKLRALDVSSLVPVQLTVLYQLDNDQSKKIILDPDKKEKNLHIQIPKGEHTVRIHISKPVANQFLHVHFVETRAIPPVTFLERIYYVATQKEPVIFTMIGPAFLRMDELYQGSLLTSYRLIKDKLEHIVLKPKENQAEALFRISQRIPSAETTEVRSRMIVVPPVPVPPPYASLNQTQSQASIVLKDGLNLGGQEHGTWSFSLSENRRKNFLQNDEGNHFTLEEFQEPEVTHRYFSENKRTYFKTTALQRIKKQGGAVLGLKEALYYQPVWYPINFKLHANVFYQKPDGNKWFGFNNKGEWSTTWVGSVSQVRHLSPVSYHIPELSGLIRTMSLHTTQQYNPGDIDQDIFTKFQFKHRKYIEISDIFYHRPWLDSLWYIGASGASTPNFKLNIGWKQLMGQITVNPDFQYARYIREKLLRRSYGINLGWKKWMNSKNFFELSINISRGMDVPVTTGFLNFTWNTSNGRGYRDFQPGEIDFLDIRTREIPSVPNNYMDETPSE